MLCQIENIMLDPYLIPMYETIPFLTALCHFSLVCRVSDRKHMESTEWCAESLRHLPTAVEK
jgi:hypothetical protein